MAQYGTYGFKINGVNNVFTIFSLSNDDLIDDAYDLYLYLTTFNSKRFMNEMKRNPDGFQYVKLNLNTGEMSGKEWQGNDKYTELQNEESPYSNLIYNVDTKTIEGDSRGEYISFKIPNIDYCISTNKNKKKIFDALFEESEAFYKFLKKYKGPRYLYKCACNYYLGLKT